MDLIEKRTQVTLADLYSTNPGTLAGRFLRRFWQPVARSQDVLAEGAYPARIMGEDLTVYRGSSGHPYVVQAFCPHRAARLSTGWVEGEDIRCRYHGWKFAGGGACVEQPSEDASFAAKVGLRAYPAQDYLGLVFAYLGEGEPPSIRRFPDFEGPGVLECAPLSPERWPCNYFNRIDNACDLWHIVYTHRASLSRSENFQWRLTPPSITPEETAYGIRSTEERPDRPRSYAHFHMPNVNQVRARSRIERPGAAPAPILGDRLFFRVPVDDQNCISFVVDHYPIFGDDAAAYTAQPRGTQDLEALNATADAILRSEQRMEDVDSNASTYQMFWMEDYVVQVGQQPISDGRSERLGRMDTGLILLRRLWLRELQALADGRPLKNWVTPPGLSGGAE
jgi:5,5'-dehydrodivanillate O-demethylase